MSRTFVFCLCLSTLFIGHKDLLAQTPEVLLGQFNERLTKLEAAQATIEKQKAQLFSSFLASYLPVVHSAGTKIGDCEVENSWIDGTKSVKFLVRIKKANSFYTAEIDFRNWSFRSFGPDGWMGGIRTQDLWRWFGTDGFRKADIRFDAGTGKLSYLYLPAKEYGGSEKEVALQCGQLEEKQKPSRKMDWR